MDLVEFYATPRQILAVVDLVLLGGVLWFLWLRKMHIALAILWIVSLLNLWQHPSRGWAFAANVGGVLALLAALWRAMHDRRT